MRDGPRRRRTPPETKAEPPLRAVLRAKPSVRVPAFLVFFNYLIRLFVDTGYRILVTVGYNRIVNYYKITRSVERLPDSLLHITRQAGDRGVFFAHDPKTALASVCRPHHPIQRRPERPGWTIPRRPWETQSFVGTKQRHALRVAETGPHPFNRHQSWHRAGGA